MKFTVEADEKPATVIAGIRTAVSSLKSGTRYPQAQAALSVVLAFLDGIVVNPRPPTPIEDRTGEIFTEIKFMIYQRGIGTFWSPGNGSGARQSDPTKAGWFTWEEAMHCTGNVFRTVAEFDRDYKRCYTLNEAAAALKADGF